MSDVKRGFSFNVNNSPITTVVADGKLWLAFYQLGEALGVGNLRKSLTNHVTDSDLTYFLMENEHSGLNRHRFISEKGVFSILQGRRDGKTDSLRLAIRDSIVPALKADRLNIDPIDVDKDADLNIYYFNLNKKRLTAVFIDNDIYFRKGDVAEIIKIHQPAFDKYVREHATKKSACLLNIPNKVNVTTRASFVSNNGLRRILIDRGGQLCDDLRQFIAMTVVPKMTPAIPESLANDSEVKTTIPKKDCTATSCPLCESRCQAGSTDSGFITNNGACLRCCFGKGKEEIQVMLLAKEKLKDDTFNDDTPAQTFGQSLNVRFDAAVGSDRGAAFFNKAYDAASERMNEHQLSVECDAPKAAQILNEAVATMVERGKSYDKNGNGAERSMDKIVAMFEALTSIKMTPAQGYKFMACLKLARSEQGEHKEDNYLDGAAYMALAGEASCSEVSA